MCVWFLVFWCKHGLACVRACVRILYKLGVDLGAIRTQSRTTITAVVKVVKHNMMTVTTIILLLSVYI